MHASIYHQSRCRLLDSDFRDLGLTLISVGPFAQEMRTRAIIPVTGRTKDKEMQTMAKDFRHYRVLAQKLSQYVDPGTREGILTGMDYVKSTSTPEVKVCWAREMMQRMDAALDPDTCIRIREECACLLSNQSSIYARTFRKLRNQYPDDDDYVDAVVNYLNSTTPLRRCGEVTREGAKIYSVIARGKCACPVLRDGLDGLKGTISRTWCHCSKGSLLSVYRFVFPEKTCRMEIVKSIASGAEECRFVTTFV